MMSKLKAAPRLGAGPAGAGRRARPGSGGARWEQGQCGLRFEGRGSRQASFGSGPCRPWGIRPSPPWGRSGSSWWGQGVDQQWHHRRGHRVCPLLTDLGEPPGTRVWGSEDGWVSGPLGGDVDGDHPKEFPVEGTVPRQDIPREGVARGAAG